MECQDKTTDSQLTNMEIDRAPAEQLLPQQFDEWMAMRYKLEKGVKHHFIQWSIAPIGILQILP